ncbi:MAG: 30S ribosomal protein S6--L-glutamate ligase [Saprospiraceae bacterium]|nr:30S ribosomal protein S6--L-glutamate ligase [Saprospiraceae bacterium]
MRIAVLSRNKTLYSTRRIVQSAIKRGHQVLVIDPLKCNLVMEKNHPQVYYGDHRLDNIDAIIPRIGTSITFYGSAVIRQFEMMNVFSTVDSNALLRSRDKLRSIQLLSREGIGFPKTVFTNYSQRIDDIIEGVGGTPLIIKSLEGTQGLGVMLLESKKAAVSVIQAFNSIKARTMVQEFIKEAKGADIRAFIVDGKIVGAMKRQGLPGDFRSNLHRGGTAELIKLNRRESSSALKAAKTMGLDVCGVDLLQSKRGPLVLEVNSSPGLEGIETATQEDIAGAIIKFVEKNAASKPKRKKRSKG